MDISKIIKEEKIIIKYQPIMSTHNKNFLGIEALVRGWINNSEVSPFKLFEEARKHDLVLVLDKLCVQKSIEGFRDVYEFNKEILLFINIDASVMDFYIHNDYIEKLLEENKISTGNIILEINELKAISLERMKEFSLKYKELGCLIALDDIGAGESNLDRIPLIMPDIMKIDKDLIQDLAKSFHIKQVVSSIIELATSLGALIVIEGVETQMDINNIAEFGAHLIQGYYLGRPSRLTKDFYQTVVKNKTKITDLMYQYNKVIHSKRKRLHDGMNLIASEMKSKIEMTNIDRYKSSLSEIICKYDVIESVYILDMEGKLLTDTIFNNDVKSSYNNSLYTACSTGDTVELEEYYTKIKYGGYAFGYQVNIFQWLVDINAIPILLVL